jgi:hypothetical protein
LTEIRLIFTLNSSDWLQLRKHQKNPLTILLSPRPLQRLITNDSINFHSHVGDQKFHLDFTEKKSTQKFLLIKNSEIQITMEESTKPTNRSRAVKFSN